MESICLFCSYFTSANIPNYVQYYAKELTRHFTRVVFITNEKELAGSSLSFLQSNNIELFSVMNEGYDFGMWYKAMLKYDVEKYDRLGLVNDSCILFKPLDTYFNWLNNQSLDYVGMTDSNEISYHLQSFFLIINKNAITPTFQLFKKQGFKTTRQEVINIYELGLCKHLQLQGFRVGAWYSCQKYMPKYNPSLYAAHKMIKDGFPLIKKKIVFNSFSEEEYNEIKKHAFNHTPNYYFHVIKKANRKVALFDFSLLKSDGYNPSLKKIMGLNLMSINNHYFRRLPLLILKLIYQKFRIRELRDKLKLTSISNG